MLKARISLNSIDKVKSFVNDISGFNAEFDLVSGRLMQSLSWVSSVWIFRSRLI